jgi:3-oxoadipate enol-lactonase
MTLAYRLEGEEAAPVLVLCGSLGTTWEVWDAQLPALTGFRSLRLDHPGHGRAPAPEGQVSVEALADDVVRILDELEVERVSFCGLSLGGLVGMRLALAAPDRLDRLVLACTSASFGPPEPWRKRAALVRWQGTAAVAATVLERWFTEGFRRDQPATVARYRAMLESIGSAGYAACCEAVGAWDARELLHGIAAPTLVVCGADDPASGPDQGTYLAERIPDARLVVVDDAAHLASVEQPERFARLLVEHVSQTEARL